MSQILRRSRWLFEPSVAVAFFVFWALSETGRHPILPGMLRASIPFWGALLLLAIAMGVSRIQPVVAMSLGTAALIGQLLFPAGVFGDGWVYLGYVFLTVVVAATVRGRMRIAALAFGAGAGVSIAGLLAWTQGIGHTDFGERIVLFVLVIAAGVVAWLLGTLVGVWGRSQASEQALARTTDELRAVETETIIAGERERIAQDVHDIMAHSLSVILAQADGSRSLGETKPEAMSRSLETISASARTSLTEVRMLIEGLVADPETAAAPAVVDIDALVLRMRDAGLGVEVERYGRPEGLTATQELAVYRIVQEGLTNALKHAGQGASARVVLDARGGGLMLSVTSAGLDAPPAPTPGSGGRGLHGMRERARLAGGWLDAGADDDDAGGFVVTAFIPAAEAVTA